MKTKTITLPAELGAGKVQRFNRGELPFYRACAKRAPTQVWAEFGVSMGNTARILLDLLAGNGVLHLFDSLQGLPEPWQIEVPGSTAWNSCYRAGYWKHDQVNFNDARSRWHVGLFADTLPVEFEEQLGLVNIDCDLYSSARDILAGAIAHIQPGTVLIFDELIEWDHINTNWREGEWKALVESGIELDWFARSGWAVAGMVR